MILVKGLLEFRPDGMACNDDDDELFLHFSHLRWRKCFQFQLLEDLFEFEVEVDSKIQEEVHNPISSKPLLIEVSIQFFVFLESRKIKDLPEMRAFDSLIVPMQIVRVYWKKKIGKELY